MMQTFDDGFFACLQQGVVALAVVLSEETEDHIVVSKCIHFVIHECIHTGKPSDTNEMENTAWQ